jgi:hypothetical protein
MEDIEMLRARLSAAATVVDTLTVAWDIFEFIQTVADGCADREPELFAAFLFAMAAAAEGRDAAGFAPSMPDAPGVSVASSAWGTIDLLEIAGQLAGLAGALEGRLAVAAGCAGDAGDRRACEHAAGQAGQIRVLLTPAGL